MNDRVRFVMRVYRVLLSFYPAAFRDEFGEEMQAVFAAALGEARSPSGGPPWGLFWREMCDWPGAVFREHIRARRWKMFRDGLMVEKPLSRGELLAAMILFVLPLLMSGLAASTTSLPQWTEPVFFVVLYGAVLFALGLAVIRGVPGWSLPYVGFLLMLGLIVVRSDRIWTWIYPVFIRLFGARSMWPLVVRVLYGAVFSFVVLFSLLFSAIIVVNLLRLLPYTRGVWQRIRADWTQLSFMLYGGLVFGVIIAFDEYRHEEPWKLVIWLCLAVGAWGYLRAKNQKRRFAALVCGASGAMWLVALAMWVLIPFQSWPMGYPVSPSPATRWTQPLSTLVEWVVFLIILTAPALLNWLPGAVVPDDSTLVAAE